MRSLIYDTETTGVNPDTASLVQVTAKLYEHDPKVAAVSRTGRILIAPIASLTAVVDAGVDVPEGAYKVHGITRERTEQIGLHPKIVGEVFAELLDIADRGVNHNKKYDTKVMAKFLRENSIEGGEELLAEREAYCTMATLRPVMQMTPKKFGDWKSPKLIEAHRYLFGYGFDGAHDSEVDVDATTRVYFAILAMQNEVEIPDD